MHFFGRWHTWRVCAPPIADMLHTCAVTTTRLFFLVMCARFSVQELLLGWQGSKKRKSFHWIMQWPFYHWHAWICCFTGAEADKVDFVEGKKKTTGCTSKSKGMYLGHWLKGTLTEVSLWCCIMLILNLPRSLTAPKTMNGALLFRLYDLLISCTVNTQVFSGYRTSTWLEARCLQQSEY